MGPRGDTGAEGNLGLAAFHLEVARLFFALPASKGFLLAGERPCSRVRDGRSDVLVSGGGS
jgi:hypothetical protein